MLQSPCSHVVIEEGKTCHSGGFFCLRTHARFGCCPCQTSDFAHRASFARSLSHFIFIVQSSVQWRQSRFSMWNSSTIQQSFSTPFNFLSHLSASLQECEEVRVFFCPFSTSHSACSPLIHIDINLQCWPSPSLCRCLFYIRARMEADICGLRG